MRKSHGTSYHIYLGIGILIGVIIVIMSSFIIKWRLSGGAPEAPGPSPEATSLPSKTVEPSTEALRVDMVKDPVCDTMVDPNSASSSKFQGKKYYFCSDRCLQEFDNDPMPYVDFTMKVQIHIEPLSTPSPESSENTETPGLEATPVETEIEIVATPKPKVEDSSSAATPPIRSTKEVKPTPEEIPLISEPPKTKPSKTKKPPSTQELQIEEIPLE